jgi:hypothetical protein
VTKASVQRLSLAHSAAWVLTQFSWLAAIKITEAQWSHIWGRGSTWGNAGCFLDATNYLSNVHGGIYFHTSYNVRGAQAIKPDVTATTWFVVAGIANGANIQVFVNRQSVSRLLQSQTINFGTNPLTLLGDGSSNSAYHPTGATREFAFWDTALTQSAMESEIDAAMSRWGISNTVTVSSGSAAGFTGLSGVGRLGT